MLSAAVVAASTGTVMAGSASAKGTIGGVDCYASLSCSITRATASTRCLSPENDVISVRLYAYYKTSEGDSEYDYDYRPSSNDRGDTEVSVTATQNIYQYQYADSYHYVSINGASWDPKLHADR